MTLALDLSNYTTNNPVPGSGTAGGRIDAALVECWKSNGFTHAIVGTQWPDVARHQLETCLENGMTTDAYHWLWFDKDYMAELQRSLETVRGFPIRRLWVDIEDPNTPKDPATLITIAHKVMTEAGRVLEAQGISVGVYTARWWWPQHMANDQSFQHYPLWHAEYFQPVEGQRPSKVPSEVDMVPPAWKPYGGWQSVDMWQYAGSVKYLCNSNLDLNVTYQPIGEQEEMFTVLSHLADADGNPIEKLEGEVAPADYGFDLARLGFPAGAKRVRVMVSAQPDAYVDFWHGLPDEANRFAGRVDRTNVILEVIPSADNKCYVGYPGATFDIQPLGYFS